MPTLEEKSSTLESELGMFLEDCIGSLPKTNSKFPPENRPGPSFHGGYCICLFFLKLQSF